MSNVLSCFPVGTKSDSFKLLIRNGLGNSSRDDDLRGERFDDNNENVYTTCSFHVSVLVDVDDVETRSFRNDIVRFSLRRCNLSLKFYCYDRTHVRRYDFRWIETRVDGTDTVQVNRYGLISKSFPTYVEYSTVFKKRKKTPGLLFQPFAPYYPQRYRNFLWPCDFCTKTRIIDVINCLKMSRTSYIIYVSYALWTTTVLINYNFVYSSRLPSLIGFSYFSARRKKKFAWNPVVRVIPFETPFWNYDYQSNVRVLQQKIKHFVFVFHLTENR